MFSVVNCSVARSLPYPILLRWCPRNDHTHLPGRERQLVVNFAFRLLLYVSRCDSSGAYLGFDCLKSVCHQPL